MLPDLHKFFNEICMQKRWDDFSGKLLRFNNTRKYHFNVQKMGRTNVCSPVSPVILIQIVLQTYG